MTGTPSRELGPARFQRRRAQERRHGFRALGAGVVLLALVAGPPAALFWLAGPPPIPTSLPTRDDLIAEIGAEQLVTVLVAVAWLAWLQFVLCVVVELRSAVSGVGLPARLPLSGPSQRLARSLIGSVLLAATTVGTATAAPAAGPEANQGAPAAVVAAAQETSSPGDGTPSVGNGPVEVRLTSGGEATYRLGDTVVDAEDVTQLVGHKVYRVQPPDGRSHDNLWDIAERYLGDGRRYKEIFELNRGRIQPDGHELSLARLIYPGWLLVMPEDAEGLDRLVAQTERAPTDNTPAPTSEPSGSPDAGAAAVVPGGGAAGWAEAIAGAGAIGGVGAVGAPAVVDLIGAAGSDVVDTVGYGAGSRPTHGHELLAAAGLLAAGLLAAIEVARRRRRPSEPDDDAVEVEVAIRIAADPDRARWLGDALRGVTAACRNHQLPEPPCYAAVVDSESVELLLAPAAAEAPHPWRALDGGRRWRLDRPELPMIMNAGGVTGTQIVHDHGDGSGEVAPYPGLVSVGRDSFGRDVLVDLEAAGGPIAVTGDPTAAYEVVTALAAELATNQWSDRLQVTAAGLPGELAALDRERYREVHDVAPVLAELEAVHGDHTVHAVRGGVDMLTGRVRSTGPQAWMPEYVVLGSEPDGETAQRLLALGSAARSPLGIVCAGDLPGARWRLEVDAAGNLSLPALGLTVVANRLAAPTAASVAAMVAPEATVDPEQGTLHEAWLPEVRPEVPEPRVAADTSALATAAVRVFVLGPAEVQAPGTIDDERKELATEMVVNLAMHREGVHPTVLAGSIWPRGVTAEVREATIARVGEWLGTSADGAPHLALTSDGRLRLSDDVVVDWEVVQSLLAGSRAAGEPAEEMKFLRRALRVARGPVLSERPRGRYAWIARVRLERTASDLLVDAAHRLSMLSADTGEPNMAAAAARAGIRVRPGEQLLWRDLLRVEHQQGGYDRVTTVVDELTTTLGGLGVAELEPETMALLEELLPAEQPDPPAAAHRGQLRMV